MRTQPTKRYDEASGQELYQPKQGEKMVTVGGYTREECETLSNMVKGISKSDEVPHKPKEIWARKYPWNGTFIWSVVEHPDENMTHYIAQP